MSWQDKIKDKYVITTGDNQRYVPKSIEFTFRDEYQIATFEFINVAGTLVKKSQPIGRKYPFKIYFDDDLSTSQDHLDIVERFRKSCEDTRPIKIEHPIYGILTVQIASLDGSDVARNVTEISGTFLETIENSQLFVQLDSKDQVPILFPVVLDNLTAALQAPVQPTDITKLKEDNLQAYKSGVPILTDQDQFEQIYNAYNIANSAIDTATATPLIMMRSTMSALSLPATFELNVQQRLNLLYGTLNNLRSTIFNLLFVSSKQLFQNNSGATLAGMCMAAATPLATDYRNSSIILAVVDLISGARLRYNQDLDSLQTPNGGSLISFVADANAILSLNQLVNLTISALYNLALSAKSERSLICENDTNLILLAHRFYGLDQNDQNIQDLIDQNNIASWEYLQIKKGRKIIYYV